ncbi:hypothetical protein WR25_03025 [Diploscapter pachys]|uniref:NR LBD domain-containing protein n=1 Tax=Diploscapter pachys TaxID=2018661 RepID=A0A2A2LU26_9BILA|nr:hypothetical protein WR25_03025 [Diploscapter pachys]
MNKDAVQHERGPRNSSHRRHSLPLAHSAASLIGSSQQPTVSLSPDVGSDSDVSGAGSNSLGSFLLPSGPNLGHIMGQMSNGLFPSLQTNRLAEVSARLFLQLLHWGKCQMTMAMIPAERQVTVFDDMWPSLFVLFASETKLITSQMIRADRTVTAKERNEVAELFEKVENVRLHPSESVLLRTYGITKDTPAGNQIGLQLMTIGQFFHKGDAFRFLKCIELLTMPASPLFKMLFRPIIGDSSIRNLISDVLNVPKVPNIMFSFMRPFPFLSNFTNHQEVQQQATTSSTPGSQSSDDERLIHRSSASVDVSSDIVDTTADDVDKDSGATENFAVKVEEPFDLSIDVTTKNSV